MKLTLNMQKTHLTHVNDGFVFLGNRIIRRRSRLCTMKVVTTIPWDKARNFRKTLTALLSRNHNASAVNMIRKLNARINGWANFYQYVDYRAVVLRRIDGSVFLRMAYWLARKYRCKIKALLIRSFRSPDPEQLKPGSDTTSFLVKFALLLCNDYRADRKVSSAGGVPKSISI